MTLYFGLERDLVLGEPGAVGTAERWWISVDDGADERGEPGERGRPDPHRPGRLSDPDLWETLDAMEGDLEAVGGAVLDLRRGGPVDDLDEEIEAFGDRLLILNSIILTERWRGYGLGPLFAGIALETLSPGARLAATHPAPVGDVEGGEHEAAVAKLGKVWSKAGFTPFRDGVWVADLGVVHLGKGVGALRERYGVN